MRGNNGHHRRIPASHRSNYRELSRFVLVWSFMTRYITREYRQYRKMVRRRGGQVSKACERHQVLLWNAQNGTPYPGVLGRNELLQLLHIAEGNPIGYILLRAQHSRRCNGVVAPPLVDTVYRLGEGSLFDIIIKQGQLQGLRRPSSHRNV